jgi:hypothetical protein
MTNINLKESFTIRIQCIYYLLFKRELFLVTLFYIVTVLQILNNILAMLQPLKLANKRTAFGYFCCRKMCTTPTTFPFLDDVDVETLATQNYIIKDNFLGRFRSQLPQKILSECEQIQNQGLLLSGHVVQPGTQS